MLMALSLWTGNSIYAQAGQEQQMLTCGQDIVRKLLKETNPGFDQQLQLHEDQVQQQLARKEQDKTLKKPTGTGPYTVNVVFHIVLNAAQISQLGGQAGIQERVNSQMEVLNRDWNAQNADSVNIPAPFKPLFGNMNVRFRLATKKPDGQSTPGYEIITTTKASSNMTGGNRGSTVFSDAKYASNGGADAWDPDKYYNVWVVNINAGGGGGVVAGFATPPRYPPWDQFPIVEQGAVVHYGAFGKRTAASQYFLPGGEEGRTLVHETGHFFDLFHIWGGNPGCGDDDGVNDTPLQADMTPGTSPTFPKTDACSPNSPGIMFMNYMDYANELSQCMFSKGQVDRAHIQLDPNGGRYPLTQQGTGIDKLPEGASFTLYPNPAATSVNLVFEKPQYISGVSVVNLIGQVQQHFTVQKTVPDLALNIKSLGAGIYIVKCSLKNTNQSIIRKLVIER